MKTDKYEVEAVVVDVLPGMKYRVKVKGTDHTLVCYPAGKMRIHFIKLSEGDNVRIEISKYDLNNGRIIRRL